MLTRPLPPAARRLLAARFARSLWQGALVATFALYLQRLHWSGAQIGALFAGSFVLGALLSLLVGPLGDRCGYRRLLVGYEAAIAVAFLLALASANAWVIAASAVFGGFGRGANGAPGCFVPVELAWLADLLSERQRARAFSLNTALGFLGMAAGAAAGAGPGAWAGWLPGAAAFRPLFALGAALSVLNAVLLCTAPASVSQAGARGAMTRAHRSLLARVTAINLCNGASVGLSGPLMTYWFAVRFQVGALQVGPMMTACFLAAALVGAVAARGLGVAGYVRLQWASLLLLLLLPLAGSFRLAAGLWVVRFALERGSAGAMESVNVGLAGSGRWGLAGGLSVASLAMPRSVGPLLAGHWIAAGAFAAPLLAAGLLQAVYLLLYRRAVAPVAV